MKPTQTHFGAHVLAPILFLLACLPAQAVADQPSELERTWQSAWIFAPAENAAGYTRTTGAGLTDELARHSANAKAIVLYAHGCDGLSEISATTGRFLAQSGFLVVEPDSFARQDKPVSCDPVRHLGGLHRAVLGWRQDEMRYAARRLAAMGSLRDIPLVLMGHSEGAITVSTLKNLPAAGRIIEGWTCHAGWPEYRGLSAPPGEPVLALVGENDPWFRAPVLNGDCGAFMHRPLQRSIVFRAPNSLAREHWLSSDPDVQARIIDFIQKIIK